jgi:hypothetical protein
VLALPSFSRRNAFFRNLRAAERMAEANRGYATGMLEGPRGEMVNTKCKLENRDIRGNETINIWSSPSGIRFRSIHVGVRLVRVEILSLPNRDDSAYGVDSLSL